LFHTPISFSLFKPYFIFLLLWLCLPSANGQGLDYHEIAGKTYGERQFFLLKNFYINDDLRADSVAYFNEVSKLLQVAEENDDEELVLECSFLKYNYLSSRNYPAYIPEMEDFLKEVDRREIRQLQARTRQAIGFHYYFEKNDFGKAYVYFKDSYPYIQDLPIEELPDKQELLYNIAFINYNIGYEFKSLEFLDEAEKLDNNYYTALECNITNTKGLIYKRRDDWEKALSSFEQVLARAAEIKNDTWIRIAKNNIAEILIDHGNFSKAEEFLSDFPEMDHRLHQEEGIIEANRLLLLAKIRESQNDETAFSETIGQLELLNRKLSIPLKMKKDIYRLISTERKQRGNFTEAYSFIDSAMDYAAEYHKLKDDEGLKRALEKEKIESLIQEQLKAENQRKLANRTQILLAVISCLIIGISVVLLKRQRTIYTKQKQEVESELNEANEKLSELVSDLKHSNREVEAYEKELENLYQSQDGTENHVMERKRILEELLSKPIMTDTKWVIFKRAFDKVYPDYNTRLQKEIPGISTAETRYMYLRKLKLAPQEIAFILGVSQGSVRQYKHRMRHKVNADFQPDFDEFLDGI